MGRGVTARSGVTGRASWGEAVARGVTLDELLDESSSSCRLLLTALVTVLLLPDALGVNINKQSDDNSSSESVENAPLPSSGVLPRSSVKKFDGVATRD
mmetsp:Transcript_5744/g.9629  ORF Transcript_5744/g.9629 Transcript_5744/m.9629 type:complete len:99 (+) Transcript_5744:1570-1866(+)